VRREIPHRSKSMSELLELSSLGADDVQARRRETPASVTAQLLATVLRESAEAGIHGSPAIGRAPYFFLSAPRAPDRERDAHAREVRSFFRLLCTYLGQVAADVAVDEFQAPTGVIPGFLPAEFTIGTADERRTSQALASCRVFVPLLSPDYVQSDVCRNEWHHFAEFDERRRRRHPFELSAIVPVRWCGDTRAELPAWAAHAAPFEATDSVRDLLREGGPAYRKAVFRLARHIHDLAECLPLDQT
jgi:hypothetical protein